ncbi:MAG TPA: SMP-30/gluconolactonase/LRE family protein, partial [Nitrosomonas sp.]|nr:SMP-30/gluconolactonase/LRE family protein [Nitrosomonas sp.]
YTAVVDGSLLRLNPDGSDLEVFVNTGGRILGFDFDVSGNIIAADALKGVLKITPDRRIEVLVDEVEGKPIRYPNSVVVASNGTIYFTDSSSRFVPADWDGTFEATMLDIVEQSATGRVIAYDSLSGRTRVIAQGLSFANGIALSRDEQTLFVVETGRYRLWKIAILANAITIGDESPDASVLLDNLPGYPDNLMRGLEGRIWLGLAKPRNTAIDFMSDKPLLRKMVLRFPRFLWPMPESYGHVIAFTETGQIVVDLQDPTGDYPETTGVTETNERLYIQSLHAKSLGWLDKSILK